MQFNLLAPAQAFLRPKNQFALFFVASFVAKLLHLGSHASSLPIVLYLLYFPTFILPDVALLVGTKLLIYTQNGGQTSAIRKLFGGLLAVFTLGCSAAQISFFVETGGEIQWMAAGRVLGSSGGLGLLLSGLFSTMVALAVLYSIAWIITPIFYDTVEHVLERISWSYRRSYEAIRKRRIIDEDQEFLIPLQEEPASSPGDRDRSADIPRPTKRAPTTTTAFAVVFTTLAASVTVVILQTVRPPNPPYAHMSGSLPITIIEAAMFQPINSEFCLAHPVEVAIFPFERFNQYYNYSQPPDWSPQWGKCIRDNGPSPPPWLDYPGHDGPPPGPPPHGPRGIYPRGNPSREPPPPGPPPPGHGPHGHGGGYAPVCDPLKISNLDASVYETLRESMEMKKPKIKNVLLLTLESTRKDMFPFKKDSHPYNTILGSYSSGFNASAELDAKLANLTKTAAFLSGESTGFEMHNDSASKTGWRAAFKDGMGGLNVQGAITQAAFTLKSLVSSHCGVEPLPVDFTEEIMGYLYQACLPQILESMNKGSHNEDSDQNNDNMPRGNNEDYSSWKWASALVQSVTDQFDSQDVLDHQMGFRHVISEETLSDPTSKHYPPKEPFANYFGYPETESFEYLRDLFVDAQKHEKRLFVSHLTSTPHHPFATPKSWEGDTAYMQKQRWASEDTLNAYLNTIKYQDEWISQIFEMLHDVGALDETLVVMTGDHGLAFSSLDNSQSTVNNGHIANFAIPLLFIHPDLPRLQVKASTTPLSIIPTVLDLLLQTNSLPDPAAKQARDLLPKYQGNSLIRNLDYSVLVEDGKSGQAFFEPWHFSAINPGGSLLAISEASTTFRLILPLCSTIPLRFTDLSVDPNEKEPIVAWTMDELVSIIKVRHGEKATHWARLAGELGRWWFWNQHERWGYWENARREGRGGVDAAGSGRIKKKHWWET